MIPAFSADTNDDHRAPVTNAAQPSRVPSQPRYILMSDAPNPFTRKRKIRRIKLAVLAVLCGGMVTAFSYFAATRMSGSHQPSTYQSGGQ